LDDSAYDEALAVFQQAVTAFCSGDIQRGNRLLATLNVEAIENDRTQLRNLARTARSVGKVLPSSAVSRRISSQVKAAVQQRDRFHCRFTGRRLIDTRVFHEVSRISDAFHFDEHHSVQPTRRGPAGHPMVRTHAAAYEHALPLVCGGTSSVDNIVHTSVQLNESKGELILDQIPVPSDDWNGLTECLEALRRQASSNATHSGHVLESSAQPKPATRRSLGSASKGQPATAYRQAAQDLDVVIFALSEDADAEQKMKSFRATHKNWFFTTKPASGAWNVHRLYCSSLDFNGKQQVTVKPKVCAEKRATIETWASRFGVATGSCKRCGKAQ
jgi:hypothetical protein